MDPLSLTAILVTILFWASSFAGIKAGLDHFTPAHLTVYRFLVASGVLLIYAWISKIPFPEWKDVPRIFGVSLLGITIYHYALNFGEITVPAGVASLIIAAGPVFTALMATLWLGERLNVLGWLGIAVSISGVTLIVLGRGGDLNFTQGALLILLSAFVTSLYFVLQKPLLKKYPSRQFTVWSLVFGTVPMLISLPGLPQEIQAAPASANWAVIYIGIFPAALAYLTWTFALSRVPASITTSFLYVSPVLAILISYFWVHEVPSHITLIGGAIALVGVVLVNTLGKPRVGISRRQKAEG
ncbi:DMT family transporter [Deinococcus roseus]|uniref:Membrane protein n=1 Tax=Deinococcus roseus TaxID=392414 RepID=A0ABQ2D4K3_9DEIO|nr:EamA family transporter [Deinococcus roseus]GGJ46061.1 membrane protein [Deinococcus roseus]